MISYRHVVTLGGTDAGWLSNMSDLAMAQIGGNWLLLAVNATGGISSYRMSDTDAPLARADAWAFPSHLAYHGQPSLTVLDLPKNESILVEGMGGAGVAGLSADAAARPGGLAQPFPADRIGARLSASGQISAPKGDFLFSARQDSLTLEVSRIEGNATLSRIGVIEARLINGRIVVFATSHGEWGITQLVMTPAPPAQPPWQNSEALRALRATTFWWRQTGRPLSTAGRAPIPLPSPDATAGR